MSSLSIPTSPTPWSRWTARFRGSRMGAGRPLPLGRQLLLQLALLLIAFSVLFPIAWIFSLSLDPTSVSRPTELRLVPPGASLASYSAVIEQPTNNDISFGALALNSFRLSAGVAAISVLIGVLAAYAFSRFKFRGRAALMLAVLTVLMLPAIATLPALYVLLNRVQILNPATGKMIFNLRDSLWGVGLAIVSTQLPFAIWNLKGFLDTIPHELEEAALIDGASANTVFTKIILPLAVPALAVTGFLSFMNTWTEFAISWQFLNQVKDHTLIMELYNMIGQYADATPWSKFAAMAVLVALPVSAVYLSLQRYIVSGLTIGSVKG
jgi:arabinogalactan oligomer / maltooligosaccharide transport system permease protein